VHGLLTHLNLNSTYLNGRTLVFKGILARYLRMLLWFPKMFTEAPAKKSKAVRRVGQKESKELNLGFCPVCWQKWERKSNSFCPKSWTRRQCRWRSTTKSSRTQKSRNSCSQVLWDDPMTGTWQLWWITFVNTEGRNREILVLRYCEVNPWLALSDKAPTNKICRCAPLAWP